MELQVEGISYRFRTTDRIAALSKEVPTPRTVTPQVKAHLEDVLNGDFDRRGRDHTAIRSDLHKQKYLEIAQNAITDPISRDRAEIGCGQFVTTTSVQAVLVSDGHGPLHLYQMPLNCLFINDLRRLRATELIRSFA